jgi:hypothetical protein
MHIDECILCILTNTWLVVCLAKFGLASFGWQVLVGKFWLASFGWQV